MENKVKRVQVMTKYIMPLFFARINNVFSHGLLEETLNSIVQYISALK